MTRPKYFAGGLAAAVCIGLAAIAAGPHEAGRQHTGGMFEVPPAIAHEHEQLHADLTEATKAGGRTGEAASRVAEVLHAHFQLEEELALPPLGLLQPLAEGRATPEMREVIALTDRLEAEMPRMLREHQALVSALEELGTAARAEGHPEVNRFAEELTAHARTEEQVLYPAAILVGEYVKLRFPR